MKNHKSIPNIHIESYLNYYCSLSIGPGFSILIKGPWGSGKTWFIKEYFKKSDTQNKDFLYISLYGMSRISEIEDSFFQLLHPIRSSKGMKIASTIIKGLLKGALKIDLNNDGKDDGTLSLSIPEIELPKSLENIDEKILVFDDIERCNIDISVLFGYINYFTEHQSSKIILIANEEKLKKNESYIHIKEKLVGKTFSVSPDFDSALTSFINELQNEDSKSFLLESCTLIKDIYIKAEYENLRILKQVILDFQRVFEALPKGAKHKSALLRDVLKAILAFSIEISRGTIDPKDISKLEEEYRQLLIDVHMSRHYSSSKKDVDNTNKNRVNIQNLLEKYSFIDIKNPFPSAEWWQVFFDKGIVDKEQLEKAISSSKYFQYRDLEDWIKLYHFTSLSDGEFKHLIRKVEEDFNKRVFTDIGAIKHIFCLFLWFSDGGVYNKEKQDILSDFKEYIDYLRNNKKIVPMPYYSDQKTDFNTENESYRGLAFCGTDTIEYKDFNSYISKVQNKVKVDRKPEHARLLLDIMKTDQFRFGELINFGDYTVKIDPEFDYRKTTLLNLIPEKEFIQAFLGLEYTDKSYVLHSIRRRYEHKDICLVLVSELSWLKSIKSLLNQEANNRLGEVSGFCLNRLIGGPLKQAIKNLEDHSLEQ